MGCSLNLWDKFAIVGIGSTEFSANSGRSEFRLALEACKAAIDDAGLVPSDIDGITRFCADSSWEDQVAQTLGLQRLRFQAASSQGGNVAAAGTVLLAGMALASGLANYVLAFRSLNERSGRRFGQAAPVTRVPLAPGDQAYMVPFGLTVPGQRASLRARRHMHEYGTTSRQFGAISVACRKHANRNPKAMFHDRPMTIEDHQASRLIADPLRMFDFCLETDGACAVVITTADRARDLKHPPAYVLGGAWGTSPAMSSYMGHRRHTISHEIAISQMAEELFGRAGVTPGDIDVAQIYDHFTALVLMHIEGLGFCKAGEGGEFVQNGRLEWPDGELPLNTAGGNLSEGYIHGMNHVIEGVRQIRGTSTSQVEGAKLVLVDGALSTMNQSNAGLVFRK